MKLKSLLLLAFVAVVMSSCLESSANYTPTINLYRPVLCTHVGDTIVDTLSVRYLADTQSWRIDTISEGDTVRVRVRVDAYGNVLTRFQAVYDTNLVELSMLVDSIQSAFDWTKSKRDDLYFKSGYNMAMFPIEYVAKKSGTTRIALHLESDSEFSPADVLLTQTISTNH